MWGEIRMNKNTKPHKIQNNTKTETKTKHNKQQQNNKKTKNVCRSRPLLIALSAPNICRACGN